IAGAMRLTLDASELLQQVIDGFFPLVPRDARPRGEAGAGLAEFGLPFASDPEISRHLAAFLAASSTAVQGNAAAADGARRGGASGIPAAVLFNGGALKPVRLRERLLDALESWAGARPLELSGADLDLAVARGAVAYGLARRGRGERIGGGAPRAY